MANRRRTFDDLAAGSRGLLDVLADDAASEHDQLLPAKRQCAVLDAAELQHAVRLREVHDDLRRLAARAAAAADRLEPLVARAPAPSADRLVADVPADVIRHIFANLLRRIDVDAAADLTSRVMLPERRNALEPAACLRRRRLSDLLALRLVCKRWRHAIDQVLDSALCVPVTKSRSAPRPTLQGVEWRNVRLARFVCREKVGAFTELNMRELRHKFTNASAELPRLCGFVLDLHSTANARMSGIDSGCGRCDTLILRAFYSPLFQYLLFPLRGARNLVLHTVYDRRGVTPVAVPIVDALPTLESLAVRGRHFPRLDNGLMLAAPHFSHLIVDAYGLKALRTVYVQSMILARERPLTVTLCPGSRWLCPRTESSVAETLTWDAIPPNFSAVTELFQARDACVVTVPDAAGLPPFKQRRLVVALDAASMLALDAIASTSSVPDTVRATWIGQQDFIIMFARAAPVTATRELHAWFRKCVVMRLHESVVLRVVETAQLHNLRDPLPSAAMADFAPPASAALTPEQRQAATARAAADWLDHNLTYSPAFELSMW